MIVENSKTKNLPWHLVLVCWFHEIGLLVTKFQCPVCLYISGLSEMKGIIQFQ